MTKKINNSEIYDLIIVGTGPAGYSAAIYGSRYGIKTLLIGQNPGGMATNAHIVDNYPGIPNIEGRQLMQKFADHCQKLGVKIANEIVKDIKKEKNKFQVITDSQIYLAKSIILALGTERRKINVSGEKEFLGKGVSYCATCDAAFFRNKTVAVIGGGDAAMQAVVQLAGFAEKVYAIYFEPIPIAMPHWQEKIAKLKSKVQSIPSNTITQISGENVVKSITLKESFLNRKELHVDGVFIEIGSIPNSVLLKKLHISINDRGYIIVDKNQATNIPGIFAAGDITTNSIGFAQIVTAASEGAISAFSAYKHLKKQ